MNEEAVNLPPMPHVQLVEILPTAVWIEDTMFGERAVMLQHEGCEPFAYATFGYDWRYTSNAGTWSAAHNLAVALGGVEPIEHRHRGIPRVRWWHWALFWLIELWGRIRRASIKREEGGAQT